MSARIAVPALESLEGEVAQLAAEWQRIGSDTTFPQALSYRADLVPTFFSFYTRLRGDGLVEAKLKELARLRIAQLNRCRY